MVSSARLTLVKYEGPAFQAFSAAEGYAVRPPLILKTGDPGDYTLKVAYESGQSDPHVIFTLHDASADVVAQKKLSAFMMFSTVSDDWERMQKLGSAFGAAQLKNDLERLREAMQDWLDKNDASREHLGMMLFVIQTSIMNDLRTLASRRPKGPDTPQ